MSILIGAVAYRASRKDEVAEEIDSWQMTRAYDGEARSKRVFCPKCGSPYALVEEADATEEMLQDDMAFLAKALSSGHPWHPARMVIRDPSGFLNRHFNCQPTLAAESETREAA